MEIRKKELYATYEEYLDLIHMSEHLNDENELLQSQLDIANKKLDKIKALVNKYGYYTLSEIPELLSIIGNEG